MCAQDRAKYVKEQIIPKAPNLEFRMIALAGGKWITINVLS